jgi:hypothetical protein
VEEEEEAGSNSVISSQEPGARAEGFITRAWHGMEAVARARTDMFAHRQQHADLQVYMYMILAHTILYISYLATRFTCTWSGNNRAVVGPQPPK